MVAYTVSVVHLPPGASCAPARVTGTNTRLALLSPPTLVAHNSWLSVVSRPMNAALFLLGVGHTSSTGRPRAIVLVSASDPQPDVVQRRVADILAPQSMHS